MIRISKKVVIVGSLVEESVERSNEEIEKLKQAYQKGIQELEIELKKERTRVSNLSKVIQPLIKRQMRKLGQEVGEEIKQTQTENKETD